jgi:hypothetical protein
MSAPSTHDQHTGGIAEAIAAVYNAAEIEPDFETPRIVPLDRLIAAHSLRRDEIPNLTRQRAIATIASMSGQAIGMPEMRMWRWQASFMLGHTVMQYGDVCWLSRMT